MKKMKKVFLCALSSVMAASLGVAFSALPTAPASADGLETFEMLGGSIRANTGTTGIRFIGKISDGEYKTVMQDETAVFGTVIAPLDYMQGIAAGADYVTELTAKNFAVAPIVHYSQPVQKAVVEGEAVDTNWYVYGSISNIRYENANRDFFGISFVRTGTEGNYSFDYPEISSVEEISRSVTEIAIMAREDETKTYDDAVYQIIDGFIARGINQANGDAETATPSVEVALVNTRSTYLVGETFDLSATYAPSNLALNVTYTSSDDSVAKITGNQVEILKAGNATITASVEIWGQAFTVEEATLQITAGTLELVAPNYMAVGKAENLSVTFNGEAVPSATYAVDTTALENANGVVTPVKAGKTTVTATVSHEGVSTEVSKEINVIDFGNTTGEMVDFATQLNAWNYRNYNNAEGVTVSYTAEKVTDGRPIANYGLHYYRPDNTGTSSGATGKLIYLHPEIVDLAKSLGYQYLSYYILVPKMSGVDTSASSVSYVVNADGSLYYEKSNTISFNWVNTTTNWTLSRINLSAITDGKGVGFIGYGQNIYLTNVYLTGTDGTANKNVLLNQSTINSQVKTVDLAKEELLGKLFVTDMSNATLSIEKGADSARNLDAVVIKRDAGSYTYSNSNRRNGLVISSEWIQAAKAKGCTCIVFRYYNANGAFTVYKVTDTDTAQWSKWADPTSGQWGFYGISLEKFKPGDRILFSFAGDTFKLSNVEFRTTYYASSLVPTA